MVSLERCTAAEINSWDILSLWKKDLKKSSRKFKYLQMDARAGDVLTQLPDGINFQDARTVACIQPALQPGREAIVELLSRGFVVGFWVGLVPARHVNPPLDQFFLRQ